MALGSLIGAGASILGGLMGKSSTEKANKKNIQLQKEFAQHGVQWKVEDARRAGVHPLYALGAQTNSFSPSVVGDTSLASGLASAGQDISRAVEANSPQSTRDRVYNDQVKALTLQKFGLENELLASQIAKSRGQVGPAIPSLGDTDQEPLTIFGKKIPGNPNFSPAEKVQNMWGEPWEWPYALVKAPADMLHAVGRAYGDRSYGMTFKRGIPGGARKPMGLRDKWHKYSRDRYK